MEDNNREADEDTSDEELFPDFDVAEERDGDPFSQIDPPADNDDTPDWIAEEDPPAFDATNKANASGEGSADSDADEVAGVDEESGDLSDISIEGDMLDSEREEDDPFGGDSLFEKVDTGTIDEEALWEEIQSDEPDTTGDSVDAVDEAIGEVVVSKSKFCQQCEYFSDPPKIGCEHEGTEIVEFVGVDDIRIKDCPVVAKERELGHDID